MGLDRRDPHRDEDDPRRVRRRSRTSSPATRSSRPAPRSIGIIPAELGAAYGVSGSNLRAVGRRLGPPPRRQALPRLPRARLQGVDAPRRRLVRPLLGAARRRRASRRGWCCRCSTACRAGRSWPRCPRIIKVPEGEVWVETENPLGQMGYYVVSKGATGPVPREDPVGVVQQRLDPAVAAAAASTFPTSSRSSRRCTSSSGTSTGDTTRRSRSTSAGAPTLAIKTIIVLVIIPLARADPRLHVPAQDDEPHAEPARADGPRRVPRLVPARGRRHEVPPEGGHHAGGGRPAGLRASRPPSS